MPDIEDKAAQAVEKADAAGESTLTPKDKAAAAVAKTPNRISFDDIKAKIAHTEFVRPQHAPHVTIAILTLVNGAVVTGLSAPADPENYDQALGEKAATDRAMDQIWAFEGYMLRQRLHDEQEATSEEPVETVDLLADEGVDGELNDDEDSGDNPDDLVQA